MLTVGKGHSLNRNISGKMNHSQTCWFVVIKNVYQHTLVPGRRLESPPDRVSKTYERRSCVLIPHTPLQ